MRDDARYRAAEAAVWERHALPSPTEHWVDHPRGRIRVLAHGEGRPVLFIHGSPTAGASLVPLAGALASGPLSGLRVLVVDRPGCGLSDPLDPPPATAGELFDATTAALAAVIEALAVGPTDVVGSSAGGAAALTLAARRPELVRTLVLEGAPLLAGARLPAPLRASSLPPVARAVTRRRVTEADLRRSFRAMGHARLLSRGGLVGPDLAWRVAVARHTDTYAHELALIRLAASWRGLRAGWAPGRDTLETVRAPSLWLVGDRDPFASPARVRAWAAHAPGSTVRILPGQGHQPWMDDAVGHARAIVRWWRGPGLVP
jgi:pimeloyl-ACP methyl ester carboxylesterase